MYNSEELGYREFLLSEFSRTYINAINKSGDYYQMLALKGKKNKGCFKLLVSLFSDLYKLYRMINLYLKERKTMLNKQNYEEGITKIKKMEELLNTIYKNIIIWKKIINLEETNKEIFKIPYESLKEINTFFMIFDELNITIGLFTQKTEKVKKYEGEDEEEKEEVFIKKLTIN